MALTEEQKQAVKEWLGQGASLSEVQSNLKEKFGIDMTYLDVRLLVLDIGVSVKDKPEPKPPKKPEPPKEEEAPKEDDPYADLDGQGTEEDVPADSSAKPAAATKVSMVLDKIVVPGAMVSGEVTFTDGTKARWAIDQYGQFGMDAEGKPGYTPTQDDLRAFQMQLRVQLRQHGYA